MPKSYYSSSYCSTSSDESSDESCYNKRKPYCRRCEKTYRCCDKKPRKKCEKTKCCDKCTEKKRKTQQDCYRNNKCNEDKIIVITIN